MRIAGFEGHTFANADMQFAPTLSLKTSHASIVEKQPLDGTWYRITACPTHRGLNIRAALHQQLCRLRIQLCTTLLSKLHIFHPFVVRLQHKHVSRFDISGFFATTGVCQESLSVFELPTEEEAMRQSSAPVQSMYRVSAPFIGVVTSLF